MLALRGIEENKLADRIKEQYGKLGNCSALVHFIGQSFWVVPGKSVSSLSHTVCLGMYV